MHLLILSLESDQFFADLAFKAVEYGVSFSVTSWLSFKKDIIQNWGKLSHRFLDFNPEVKHRIFNGEFYGFKAVLNTNHILEEGRYFEVIMRVAISVDEETSYYNVVYPEVIFNEVSKMTYYNFIQASKIGLGQCNN